MGAFYVLKILQGLTLVIHMIGGSGLNFDLKADCPDRVFFYSSFRICFGNILKCSTDASFDIFSDYHSHNNPRNQCCVIYPVAKALLNAPRIRQVSHSNFSKSIFEPNQILLIFKVSKG
jgi:hypothetical protein